MEITGLNFGSLVSFKLPAPLTFQHVFQSCSSWDGINSGSMLQVVKPLRANQRKYSYLLKLDGRQLVLSAIVGAPPFFDLHRESVHFVIQNAERENIAPALIYNSFDKGFIVTDYLEGRCWAKADFKERANIERLSALLRKLHGLPKKGPVFSISKKEQYYWSEIRCGLRAIPERLHALQLRMRTIISYVRKRHSSAVVCHNNLLTSQVLETEDGLRLVGWEYAAVNDPYYDLAVIVHRHQLNEAELDYLLLCYAGGSDVDKYEHFYYSYAIYIYLEILRCWKDADESQSPVQELEIETNIDTLIALLHRLS